MNRLTTSILLLCSLLLVACGAPRDLVDKQSVKIDKNNVSLLSGSYCNMKDSTICTYRECTLWDELQPFYAVHNFNNYQAEPEFAWEKEHIEIEIIDSKFIRFSFFSDQKKIKSKRFRYKIKDGYLTFKRFSFKGIPPILYWYKYQELYFSIDLRSNLVLDVQGESAGGIFFIIFGSPDYDHKKFKKI